MGKAQALWKVYFNWNLLPHLNIVLHMMSRRISMISLIVCHFKKKRKIFYIYVDLYFILFSHLVMICYSSIFKTEKKNDKKNLFPIYYYDKNKKNTHRYFQKYVSK